MKKNLIEQGHFLTFQLGDEFFGIEVSRVREVLDPGKITRVPRSPDYMLGVMNVRGSVVPVADMRRKIGLPEGEHTIHTRIVVLEMVIEEEKTFIAARMDSVHEVIEITPEQVEKAPSMGSRWRKEFIRGIAKHNDEFIILLDFDRMFSSQDTALLEKEEKAARKTEAQGSAARETPPA